MVEISAKEVQKEIISVATPRLEEVGFIMNQVRVEYEWKQPKCNTCKVFGHTDDECPRKPRPSTEKSNPKTDEEGFQAPKKKVNNISRATIKERRKKGFLLEKVIHGCIDQFKDQRNRMQMIITDFRP